MYYFKYKKTVAQRKTSIHTKPMQLTLTTKSTHSSSSEPEFDFYQILPKMAVNIPNGPQAKRKGHYLLQVASLQKTKDAQHLKSRLLTLGYVATIETYRAADGTVWNRVFAGPFQTLSDAEDAQEALAQQRYESLLIKAK